jgi:hypothetical protein
MAIKKVEKKEFIDISPIRYENYIDFLLPFDTCYHRLVDQCADAHESIEHCIECSLNYFRSMLLDDSYVLDFKERYFFEGMVDFLENKIRDFQKTKRKKNYTLKDRFYILRALGITKLDAWSNLNNFQQEVLLSDVLDCHPDTVREYRERADVKSEQKMADYLNQLKSKKDEKKG